MRNVLLLELLLQSKKLKLTTSAERNCARLRRQVACATLASCVNQLGA